MVPRSTPASRIQTSSVDPERASGRPAEKPRPSATAEGVTAADVAAGLRPLLEDARMPTAITVVPTIPKLLTGKADRAALRPHAQGRLVLR